ncbi:Saccharopine dehydrogenase, NADP-dependent [Filimonas lacunae]|uniref:Saccharopine dehydrogenase, NADP-dependent n=1 Tax=Filimonas lacunae TaxID=477680 RepID=A0A173MFI0_9BACT|nr:saccharopine dehydrogenase C-terminal domain-containing protein [Filimonas lacunae]BAV06374.1 saccharopine dehydrogenase [NADP, L-glutamate-forming] [Filimonas lacunae]SIT26684.1 Saccharopine dehydrogenase, NADP-dependent [Filimonas lacunae]
MKHILLFGAGKSATVLIQYLLRLSQQLQWRVTIVDGNAGSIQEKIMGNYPLVKGAIINLENETERVAYIQESDLVISLMPPALHIIIARDCVSFKKHLLTASYIDDSMRALQPAIEQNDLLFLCEMGLDPGIDHMSAGRLIHSIHTQQGIISSFQSHCGGLVAPENDTNPWHYKISWNPRNVVMAGKSGAVYKQNNEIVSVPYSSLFAKNETVSIPHFQSYVCYPNRDSLSYIGLYDLQKAHTFVRTTLRHPHFCIGWRFIVDWQLTNEEKVYATDGLSIQGFFLQHFSSLHIDSAYELKPDTIIYNQLVYLGLNDNNTLINKGLCSAADVLQWLLETRLPLLPDDKDLVVMMHELKYTIQNQSFRAKSYLVVEGKDDSYTAMAQTVGLPLGIAAKLILEGVIRLTGLHIPLSPVIYHPVLSELETEGIRFTEEVELLS